MYIHANNRHRGAMNHLSDRCRRARDSECPPARLTRLAQDDSRLVRFLVASNVSISSCALALLTVDHSPTVAKYAERHPGCPS